MVLNIEILLYVYLFVCVGMILFSIITVLRYRHGDAKTEKIRIRLEAALLSQLARIRSGEAVEERHKRALEKKLCHVDDMRAFDAVLEKLYARYPQVVQCYLSQLDAQIAALARHYGKKDSVEAAYYPYMIQKYQLIEKKPTSPVADEMCKLLTDPSLYCRENALQAIYAAGDGALVRKALKIIDAHEYFFHGRLITEGLLSFAGDHAALNDILWEDFDGFSLPTQVALLNYFRLDSGEYGGQVLKLMEDPKTNPELRYACIRYFGKHHYPPARQALMDFVANQDTQAWEYAAIAASALSLYPSKAVIKLLKDKLHSENWYVRTNAAESLAQMGQSYADVLEGTDLRASKTLRYRLDQQAMRKKEARIC